MSGKDCPRAICPRMMKKIIKYEEIVNQLKADLAREKEEHQYDNLVHEKELKNLAKL